MLVPISKGFSLYEAIIAFRLAKGFRLVSVRTYNSTMFAFWVEIFFSKIHCQISWEKTTYVLISKIKLLKVMTIIPIYLYISVWTYKCSLQSRDLCIKYFPRYFKDIYSEKLLLNNCVCSTTLIFLGKKSKKTINVFAAIGRKKPS